jgi:hypothetical protein
MGQVAAFLVRVTTCDRTTQEKPIWGVIGSARAPFGAEKNVVCESVAPTTWIIHSALLRYNRK